MTPVNTDYVKPASQSVLRPASWTSRRNDRIQVLCHSSRALLSLTHLKDMETDGVKLAVTVSAVLV